MLPMKLDISKILRERSLLSLAISVIFGLYIAIQINAPVFGTAIGVIGGILLITIARKAPSSKLINSIINGIVIGIIIGTFAGLRTPEVYLLPGTILGGTLGLVFGIVTGKKRNS